MDSSTAPDSLWNTTREVRSRCSDMRRPLSSWAGGADRAGAGRGRHGHTVEAERGHLAVRTAAPAAERVRSAHGDGAGRRLRRCECDRRRPRGVPAYLARWRRRRTSRTRRLRRPPTRAGHASCRTRAGSARRSTTRRSRGSRTGRQDGTRHRRGDAAVAAMIAARRHLTAVRTRVRDRHVSGGGVSASDPNAWVKDVKPLHRREASQFRSTRAVRPGRAEYLVPESTR